jgi:hypothetical protein
MADFKATIITDGYGGMAECTPMDQLKVASNYRLAGGVFNDSVLDTNFYTATTATGGTASVSDGVLTCAVTATSGSTACVSTNRPGRYIGSNSNYYRGNVRITVTNGANNVVIWGAVNGTTTPTNGNYFKLSDGVLSLCHKTTAGTEVAIASGSFNGSVSSYTLDTNCHTFEIYYTVRRVRFVIDGVLLHTFTSTDTPLFGEMHLRAALMNVNTGAGVIVNAHCMTMTISRLGEAHSTPKYQSISGAATTLLKTGPGSLHTVIVGVPKGSLTLYDSTTGAGTVIAVIDMSAQTTASDFTFGCDFTNGLTAVTTSTSNVTLIYE